MYEAIAGRLDRVHENRRRLSAALVVLLILRDRHCGQDGQEPNQQQAHLVVQRPAPRLREPCSV